MLKVVSLQFMMYGTIVLLSISTLQLATHTGQKETETVVFLSLYFTAYKKQM